MEIYFYKVREVTNVVDGDTVDMVVDLGFQVHFSGRFRMSGYDAPETVRSKTESERKAGNQVRSFVVGLLHEYKDVLYVKTSRTPDSFARYSAIIYAKLPSLTESLGFQMVNLNEMILKYMRDNKLTKQDVLSL